MGEPGLTLGEIAAAIGATLEGDAGLTIRGVAPLETAGPGQIAFLTDARSRARARASRAAAILAPPDVALSGPVLRSRSPRLALVALLELFHPPAAVVAGVDPTAVVAAGARVDPSAAIGALAVVESGAVIGPGVRLYPLVYVGAAAEIGEGSVLYPHVVVRDGTRLGRRVIVHPGAILGADGFGYVHDGHAHRKIPQVGVVVVEDEVEIGANTTVDRATLGVTVIRRGTKIDNLVHVAHNVEIGEGTIIAAQTGISGSCRIGRDVVLGGQVGIGDHVTIGDGAMLGSQCGVMSDVAAGEKLTGTYARPVTQQLRIWHAEAQLPDLIRRVRALEQRLGRLEGDRPRTRARKAGDDGG